MWIVAGLEDGGGRGKKCDHFELLWGLIYTSVFLFNLLGGESGVENNGTLKIN